MRSGAGTIAIRPERLRLTNEAGSVLTGTVRIRTFVSVQMIYRIVLDDGKELIVKEADNGAAWRNRRACWHRLGSERDRDLERLKRTRNGAQ